MNLGKTESCVWNMQKVEGQCIEWICFTHFRQEHGVALMSSTVSTLRYYRWWPNRSYPSCHLLLLEHSASCLKDVKLSWSGHVESSSQWTLVWYTHYECGATEQRNHILTIVHAIHKSQIHLVFFVSFSFSWILKSTLLWSKEKL